MTCELPVGCLFRPAGDWALGGSAGGICFEVVGCEIALGEVLRLTFNVQDETIVAVGRVNWCTDVDAFTQEIGLEFIEIDPFALQAIERNSEGGVLVD